MKKILFIIILLSTSIISHAQIITVRNNSTLQPVPDVAIFSDNPKLSAVTNSKGQADLTSFKGADLIWFSHISYIPRSFSYIELSQMNFIISLTENSQPLNAVVISASRFREEARDIAQPVMSIDSRELKQMNQPTTADVLQNTGNVFVQKSQLGGGSPVIRGFETNKVLMVVDGVRMNNAIYRGGHLQNVITLDNMIMDRVEVVFGPGSTVYGSDALGGVMHFYTRNPLLSDSSGMRVNANAMMRYATAASENTGHFDFSIAGKKIGFLTSITYSDFGDLRQGNIRNPFYGDWGKRLWYVGRIDGRDSMVMNSNVNIQKQSGYKQYDFLEKILFKQNDHVSHILNFQYSTSSDIPRYDRLTLLQGGNPRFAEWYYGPQERLFASYTLDLHNGCGIYDEAKIIAGYQKIEESRNDRRFNNNTLNHRTESLDIFTFNADFAKAIKSHEIRFGLEGWYNDVQSEAHSENILTGEEKKIDTRYPDGGSTMMSGAAYLTHAFEITKNLVLNDGIRVSHVELNSMFDDTTFFPFPFREVTQKNTAINGNLGLVYMPHGGWRFTLLGSSGFRAPNVDDLSKVFESTPGSVIVPNPDLKPEYTYNADFGISKTFNKLVTIGGTGYYTLFRDAITTTTGKFNGQDSIMYSGLLSQVKMNVNANEAYIYGFNAFLNADITENFSVTNSVNFTYGRIKTDTTDYPLDHIPPVFGKTSFHLKLRQFHGEFFVMYNGPKNSKDYNLLGEDNQSYSADPVKGYMPAWMTLNIRSSYQVNRNVGIQLALENILDQNYRVFASNISAPGRNFVVTVRGNF